MTKRLLIFIAASACTLFADGRSIPATARLADGKIIVTAGTVNEPKHVRYGWHKRVDPTLYNREGRPTGPFRTDDFKQTSEGRHNLDRL